MFDRCSSGQPPPDPGLFPPASHFSDPNAQNQQGFYRENSDFYPENSDFYQNYPQDFPHATSQHQRAPFPQSGHSPTSQHQRAPFPQSGHSPTSQHQRAPFPQSGHSPTSQHQRAPFPQSGHSPTSQHQRAPFPQSGHSPTSQHQRAPFPQSGHSPTSQHQGAPFPQSGHSPTYQHQGGSFSQSCHSPTSQHQRAPFPQSGHSPTYQHQGAPFPQSGHCGSPTYQHQGWSFPQSGHSPTSQHQGAPFPQSSHSPFAQMFPQDGFPQTEHRVGQFQFQNPRFDEQQVTDEYGGFYQTQRQMEPPPQPPPQPQPQQITAQVSPDKRKRGRPGKKPPLTPDEQEAQKKKRNLNRFDGLSVEEVMSRTLPDVIEGGLDILIIGINPGLMSAYKGHHYPNPGNHFWKCLFLSGLTEKQLNSLDDQSLPQKYGIGFTNMVERTTPGSKDLSSKEIREGGRQLLDKLQTFKPLIAAFNGKGIYEIFCKETFGVKAKNLEFGLQPYKIPETETVCFLMPSSSPRCAQFPRAQDKVHFYIKLKELRDRLKGTEPSRDVEETRYCFDLDLAKEDAKRLAIKEEQLDPEYESCAGVSSEPPPPPPTDG